MTAAYQVRLRNQAGQQVALFTHWRGLSIHKQVNDVGIGYFTLGQWDDRRTLFEIDGQVEVLRSDPEHGLEEYVEWGGLHRGMSRGTFEAGSQNYLSYIRGYLDILRRRHIMYHPQSSYAIKTMDAAQAMREYVNENAGPIALSPPRLLGSGVFPGLTVIGTGVTSGVTWSGDRAFKNLYQAVDEIAATAECDYDIHYLNTEIDGDAAYGFQVYPGQRGSDLTTIGLDPLTGKNAAGHEPVILSLDFGNLKRAVLIESRVQENNRVFVLGNPNENDVRFIVMVEDQEASGHVPTNLSEMTVDARSDENTLAALQSVGIAAIRRNKLVRTFSFLPQMTDATVYGRDFQLGDKLTIRDDGEDYHQRLIAVDLTVNQEVGGEQIDLTFEEIAAPDEVLYAASE